MAMQLITWSVGSVNHEIQAISTQVRLYSTSVARMPFSVTAAAVTGCVKPSETSYVKVKNARSAPEPGL